MAKGKSGGEPRKPRRPQASSTSLYDSEEIREHLSRRSIADAFLDDDEKRLTRLGIPKDKTQKTPIMVELNLMHAKGLQGAERDFLALFDRLLRRDVQPRRDPPQKIAETYYRCEITLN